MALRAKLSPLRDKLLGRGSGDSRDVAATGSGLATSAKVKVTDKPRSRSTAGKKGRKGRQLGKPTSPEDDGDKYDDSRGPEEMGEEVYECQLCGKDAEGVVQCERCMRWCCGPCQNVNTEMMESLEKWPILHWFCTMCDSVALEAVRSSMTIYTDH